MTSTSAAAPIEVQRNAWSARWLVPRSLILWSSGSCIISARSRDLDLLHLGDRLGLERLRDRGVVDIREQCLPVGDQELEVRLDRGALRLVGLLRIRHAPAL